MINNRGLSKIGRIIYSIGRFGSTTLITIVSLTSYYFYLEFMSVDPLVNGIAHSLSRILMAVTGFLFGYLSDLFFIRRLGKRKPFIILGSFLLSISFIMLYNPLLISFRNNKLFVMIYEFIWLTFLGIGYSALIIPYQAWMPEITSPDERAEVSFYQNIFNFSGNIVGIGASFALAFLIETSYMTFFQFVILISIIEIILYAPLILLIRVSTPNLKSPNILKEIKIIIRDKNFVLWEATRGFSSAGVAIFIAMIIDFITNYLKAVKIDYLIDGVIITITVILSIPTLFRVSKKYGMKKTMYYSLFLLSTSLMILTFIPILQNSFIKTRAGLILLTLSVIGLIGYWIFNYAITANIIDMNMFDTGESRAGTYTGVDNINVNFFQSLGYMLLGISLKYLVTLSELIWSLLAGILILIGLIPFKYVRAEIKESSSIIT